MLFVAVEAGLVSGKRVLLSCGIGSNRFRGLARAGFANHASVALYATQTEVVVWYCAYMYMESNSVLPVRNGNWYYCKVCS